ncbi:MAG: MAP7 domain-containing protein [Halioglobus sp.]
MNRFNLTFSGEIIAGHDPAEVKLRFGKLFAIDDPVRLDRFFSGETITLRRNLERKEAAHCYHELHLLGAVGALVKITASEAADTIANTPSATRKTAAAPDRQGAKTTALPRRSGSSEQTWAVSTATTKRKSNSKNKRQQVVAKSQEHSHRDRVDITAGIKARKLSAGRAKAEKAAQEKVARAEQQRRAREEEARLAALAAERQRIAEEEAARAAQEQKRKAEEAAARQAAQEAEAKRKAAEEAARKAAEEAALKQRAAEEAARIKAAKAAARRKAAEEEAQRKAQRQRAKAERARQKAEHAARRKAELEAIKRQQAEEEARRRAQQAELKRREAEEEARLRAEIAAIKRREEAEAARLQAELQAKAREAAAQAERIKQEAQRLQLEAERKSADRRRAAAQAVISEPVQRDDQLHISAPETLPATVSKPAKARVKKALELPQRSSDQSSAKPPPVSRKRQPGEPNLYKLRPFRANGEVRTRAQRAQQLRRRSYTVGMIALAALLLGMGSFLQRSIEPVINGPRALAIPPHSGPMLLAGNSLLFHDRAGISTSTVTLHELQLITLEAPIAYDSEGVLFARGSLAANQVGGASNTSLQVLRCDPPLSACREFSGELQGHTIDTFVLNPVDGSLLLVDAQAGLLIKADRDGKILASTSISLPAHPILRLHGGLLLINSAAAPALSVLRYENNAFGKQLDEILLLPPAASDAELLRVSNFLWSGDAWWASLENTESGAVKLYRFDENWNYLNEVALPYAVGSLNLTAWGTKTLVSSVQHVAVERFNAEGAREVSFVSSALETLRASQQKRLGIARSVWGSGLLLCALVAALGLSLGYLHNIRALVYHTRRESGAQPIDAYANALQWIDPVSNRKSLLRRRTASYGLLVLGLLLVAVALSVTVWQLAALLLALVGPLIALMVFSRQPIGHVGVLDNQLLLVDHSDMYHLAGGSRIQHSGPFLCIDDVVVFTGTPLLPAFSPAQIQKQIRPLALEGIKVDRNTVLVKLIQSRHPLAAGALAILGMAVAALLVLCIQAIY